MQVNGCYGNGAAQWNAKKFVVARYNVLSALNCALNCQKHRQCTIHCIVHDVVHFTLN